MCAMWFSNKILDWYRDNGRSLPWRGIQNPYHIWLSEIILQQTRIEQGRDYYFRFIEEYPTVKDLALASQDQVLKTWQGLGYYSRARNLHSAAQYIHEELCDVFPSTYEGILKLKGVGKYTAAAIASFAFKLPYPVIDGNVYRFISRLFGISTPVPSSRAFSEFETLLAGLIDKDSPDLFNQAIMDFGSIYCKPTGCDCANCIFVEHCEAYKRGIVDLLPVKMNGPTVKERWLYYFRVEWTLDSQRYILMQQRSGKDIWQGLWEFPVIEASHELDSEELELAKNQFLSTLGISTPIKCKSTDNEVHKLTHRIIRATFVYWDLDNIAPLPTQGMKVFSMEEMKKLPISRLIDRYLSKK